MKRTKKATAARCPLEPSVSATWDQMWTLGDRKYISQLTAANNRLTIRVREVPQSIGIYGELPGKAGPEQVRCLISQLEEALEWMEDES